MSVVVSDASPIHYLILCDAIDLLPQLFSRVIVPQSVARELSRPSTPPHVSHWIEHLPHWAVVEIGQPIRSEYKLDPGEAEAIGLALSRNSIILIDERIGRHVAQTLGLQVLGTIGLLGKAARQGLVDVPAVISRLRASNMHLSDELLSWLRSHSR
jgi:predicted nucleic acid-binding protein